MNKIIKIPFAGFYCSIFSAELDNVETQQAENIAEDKPGIESSDIAYFIWRNADYRKAFRYIAEKYVDGFNDLLHCEFGVDLGLQFESMASPREYNFETDRIFCTISESAIETLRAAITDDDLADQIKESFSPRSGFIPFYSNNIEDWNKKQLIDFDHNELCTLLDTLLRPCDDYSFWIFEALVDANVFDQAIDNAVDWDAVNSGIAEKLAEQIN